MPVTQAEVAEAWGVSRGLVSRYVKRGMPLDSLWDAERWIGRFVPHRRIKFRASDRQDNAPHEVNLPVTQASVEPDPRQGDPNWKMTTAETIETVRILIAMKAEGATRRSHPKHQAFCDGVRLACDRGVDLTPEQWRQAREEE